MIFNIRRMGQIKADVSSIAQKLYADFTCFLCVANLALISVPRLLSQVHL